MYPVARERVLRRKGDAMASALLVAGGGLLALWTAIPQPDSEAIRIYIQSAAGFGDKIMAAFATLWDGFAPTVVTGDVLQGAANSFALHFVLGLILFPITLAFFWRCRIILWTYLCGACLLLLFAFMKVENSWRHAGHFFLWFLACLWLAHYFQDTSARPLAGPYRMSGRQTVFVCAILIFQVIEGAATSIGGYYYPFSCSKAVALYIEKNDLEGLPILGYPDYAAMPVAGYLSKPIYYPDTHRWGTFIIENNKRQPDWNVNQILEAVSEFAAQGNDDFLVLLDQPLRGLRDNQPYEITQIGNLRKIASFDLAITVDEEYWLYRYEAPSGLAK